MSFTMILSRMWRNRRTLLVLGLAMSLVSGFFALGPLYLRSISNAALRYTLDSTPAGAFSFRLDNSAPIDLTDRAILDQELSGMVANVDPLEHSAGIFCYPKIGDKCYGDHRRGYLPVAFSNQQNHFTLVEGRFPQSSPTANEVEAVLTTNVALQARLNIGDSFILNQPDSTLITVLIVGLVDPVQSIDPFWDELRIVNEGVVVDVDENNQRLDMGLIMDESVFNTVIAPIGRGGNLYQWYIATNSGLLRAESLDGLSQSLDRVQTQFRLHYQNVELRGGLFTLIAHFQANIAAAEAPVILLSSGIVLLMLFQLMTTVALILEQESLEWASITSRGGSVNQLIRMQLTTVMLLGAGAFVVGLFLAPLALIVIEHVGPLAAITSDAPLAFEALPTNSILLSLAAEIGAVILLTLPAYPSARSSILRLNQSISRPPTRPTWARFYIDGMLLILGGTFLLRLYFLVGGDARTLLSDPAVLIRVLSANPSSGLLTDPFTMIGAALLLVGVALLWLRIFPLLLRLVSALFKRLDSLLVPLALWSVERDPSHYAQLVLLLIGTLALGTASLALSGTHDAGAWQVATYNTGGDARLQFDPVKLDPKFDPRSLPSVVSGIPVMKVTTTESENEVSDTLFGIDPNAELPAALREAVEPLAQTNPIPLSGIALPDNAAQVSLQVYAELSSDGKTVQTRPALELIDTIGVPHTLAMTSADETLTGEFHEYRATLPADIYLPWRIVGIRLLSRVNEQGDFAQSIFIDDLATVDSAGNLTGVDDFERVAATEWTAANQAPSAAIFSTITSAHAATGNYSLRINYSVAQQGGVFDNPDLIVNRAIGASNPILVVISQAFAAQPRLTDQRSHLMKIGDEGTIHLKLPPYGLDLHFRVVGIVNSFPTTSARDHTLIARLDSLLPLLNSIATPQNFYNVNQLWLSLTAREPSADFKSAAAAAAGVVDATYAWDSYNGLRREPLPNAITGMLFAGFWVSLGLGLLDFGFYLAMTARRRATSFAV
ncbi:MAG: hypothetical protein ABI700_18010, partial [Chloroflexota bacterium]